MQKKKQLMLQIILIIVTMLTCILPPQQTYAGGINSEEQEVVAILSSEFTYEGTAYRADPQYLQMAIDYLKRDDIDLTPEQKIKAIDKIYSNVKTAVDSKYILPVPKTTPAIKEEPTATVAPTKEPTATVTPTEEPVVTVVPTEEPTVTIVPTEPTQSEAPDTSIVPTVPVLTETPTKIPTKVPTDMPTVVPEKEVTITEQVGEIQKEQESIPFSFHCLQETATIFLLIAAGLIGITVVLLLFSHKRKHRREKKLCDVFCMTAIAVLLAIVMLLATTFLGAFLNHRNYALATETGLIQHNYQTYQAYLKQDLNMTQITTDTVNEQLSWDSYYLTNEQFLQTFFLHNQSKDFSKEQQKKTELLASQFIKISGADTLPDGRKLFVIAEDIVDHYYDFSFYEPLSFILENKTTYEKKLAVGISLGILGVILTLILLRKNHKHLRSFFKRVGRACYLAAILSVPACFLLSMREENKSTAVALNEFWNQYCQTLRNSMLIGAVLLLLLGAIISLATKHTGKRSSLT